MRTIDKLIVHCSATPNDRNVTVEDIRKWHVEDNGWADIGYHYVITRDGAIHSGRPVRNIGAHCIGQNTSSIGVCLVGDDEFEHVQLESLKALYATLKNIYNLKPYGHRDFTDKKTCPNFEVRDILCSQE